MTPSATLSESALIFEPRGRQLDQDGAHFRRRQPQRGAGILDRLRAGGHALVRRAAGIAGNHGHARQRQVEFLRGDLRQRRQDPLPQLDLAGEHGRGAVGIDADPGVERPVVVQAAGQRRGGCCAAAGSSVKASTMPPKTSAKTFGEVAPVEGNVHVTSSPSRRRRAGSRARCGCASRSGKDSRRAPRARPPRSVSDCGRAAPWRVMIMPLMQ